jgi:putative membrane protein
LPTTVLDPESPPETSHDRRAAAAVRWHDEGMGFVVRVVFNAVAVWLATVIVPGLEVVGGDTTGARIGVLLVVGLIFGLVNAVVKPVLQILSLPLLILTLGLFLLVVNALMLELTAWITSALPWGLTVNNFGTAVLGAIVISIVSFGLSLMTGGRDRQPRRT